jgi:hypothetical protein
MNSTPDSPDSSLLRPVLPGLLLAICTLLFGFGLGVVFGVNEKAIKARLRDSAAAVRDTVYKGDDAAIKTTLERSWVYMQRAHLHAGGLGSASLGLILVLVLLRAPVLAQRAVSLALGTGSLGYSIYWLWAGFLAPGLGGTGRAKESLKWFAMPASGAVVLATVTVAVLLVRALAARPKPQA